MSAERIARHGFADRPAGTPAEAARLTTAIQAQDALQSRLGVRSRATDVTEADVVAAIADRTVVRTWLMRGTIHLVATPDVRWLTRVIGPSIARRYRKRWLDLGLTPGVLRSTADALPAVLADGPRTRREIVAGLAERGVHIPMLDDAAPNHVLVHATGLGLVCRATDRGRDGLFALLDDWVPDAPAGPSGDEALAELVRRYFAAFAPATAADFTTWSGLPSAAIDLVRDELEPVDVAGRPGFRLRPAPHDAPVVPAKRGTVRLVAGFDNYLVGYRDRDLHIAEEHRPAVYVGGVIKPTVLLDGRIVAVWRLTRTPKDAAVTVTPLEPLSARTRSAIEREVRDIGRFVGQPARLVVEQ